MIRSTTTLLLALSLAGCAMDLNGNGRGSSDSDLAGNIVSYDCDDDRSFTAAYDQDMENVSIGGSVDAHRLHLGERSGDRRSYAGDDGKVTLEVAGDEAALRVKGEKSLEDCRAGS
jgi:hypothetical protein